MDEPVIRPLRDRAPLLDAYLTALDDDRRRFNIPGHKLRADGIDTDLGRLLAGDVPLYGGLEDMHLSSGLLAASERRVAEIYGADWCRFSVGGTSHTNIAAALAVRSLGHQVIATRTMHKSTLLGMILAGLEPHWLNPRIHSDLGLPRGLDPAAVEQAVVETGAAAVLLTEPSYVGTLGQIAETANLAHRHGAAVVVDQAWAPHFGFAGAVPSHALTQGADLATWSVHKVGLGYSQASLIAARTRFFDAGSLDMAFEAQHTTSPAGSILASIEASILLFADRGETLLGRLVERLDSLRSRLRAAVPGLEVADESLLGRGDIDPAKLVIMVSGTGADGAAVATELAAAGTVIEYATRDVIIPIVTVVDDDATLDALFHALVRAIEARRREPRPTQPDAIWTLTSQAVMSPRAAYFAPFRAVGLDDAVGEVSQELAALYPPGVAVLVPGEVITTQIVEALRGARGDGRRVAYLNDQSLSTIRIVT